METGAMLKKKPLSICWFGASQVFGRLINNKTTKKAILTNYSL